MKIFSYFTVVVPVGVGVVYCGASLVERVKRDSSKKEDDSSKRISTLSQRRLSSSSPEITGATNIGHIIIPQPSGENVHKEQNVDKKQIVDEEEIIDEEEIVDDEGEVWVFSFNKLVDCAKTYVAGCSKQYPKLVKNKEDQEELLTKIKDLMPKSLESDGKAQQKLKEWVKEQETAMGGREPKSLDHLAFLFLQKQFSGYFDS